MSGNVKTLVIATSLRDRSDAVVRSGALLARALGATPWLVHVESPPTYLGDLAGSDEAWAANHDLLVLRLEQQAARSGFATVPGFDADRLFLAAGSRRREIVALARKAKADLIVVGASETPFGSTPGGVLRDAPCPVLVVESEIAGPPTHVELPVDFSPFSARAVTVGLSLLEQWGAHPEVEAFLVLDPDEVHGSRTFTHEQLDRFARAELERFVADNATTGTACQVRVQTGQPANAILNVVWQRKVDLLVLGTHGRRGFNRLLLGSVATVMLAEARCNLLLVPPGAELEAGLAASTPQSTSSSVETP